MPAYKAYPTVKDTPNRKQRKSRRRDTFAFNRSVGAEERKARRKAKG